MNTPSPIIIGFTGKKQSGKNTCALFLSNLLPIRPIDTITRAFATPIYYEISSFFGIPLDRTRNIKDTPEGRKLLQWWGTELRRSGDPEYWIKLYDKFLATTSKHIQLVYTPDCRFLNEAEYIKKRGGIVIRVINPLQASQPIVDTHISETEQDKIEANYEIENPGNSFQRFKLEIGVLADKIKSHYKLWNK